MTRFYFRIYQNGDEDGDNIWTLRMRVRHDKKLNMSTGASTDWNSSGLKNSNDYGTNKNKKQDQSHDYQVLAATQ